MCNRDDDPTQHDDPDLARCQDCGHSLYWHATAAETITSRTRDPLPCVGGYAGGVPCRCIAIRPEPKRRATAGTI